jgi:putative redox protein
MIRSFSLDVPYQIALSNGSQSAVADLPREKGGEGKGFGPHELLEAALATCVTMTVRMYAAKYNIPMAGVQCAVRLDRSVPNAVTLHYDLSFGGPVTDEQANQLREAASKCPVARTLTGAIAVQPVPPGARAEGAV